MTLGVGLEMNLRPEKDWMSFSKGGEVRSWIVGCANGLVICLLRLLGLVNFEQFPITNNLPIIL